MSGLSSNLHNYKKVHGGLEFSVSAPGKVILHGEHSVVYGKLAVAASLDLRTKIHLMEIDCSNVLILKLLPMDFEHVFDLNVIQKLLLDKPPPVTTSISDFNWESPKLLNHQAHLETIEKAINSVFPDKNNIPNKGVIKAVQCLFYLLSGVLSSTNVNLKPLCITIDSELSMGAGTGSSASFSVTFAGLFVHLLKLKTLTLDNVSKTDFKRFIWDNQDTKNHAQFNDRELEAISDWAFCGEKLFHGTPSGLDNTICTYGNLVKFRKNHSTTHLTLTTPLNLLLINTKVPRETLKMVAIVAKLKTEFPHVVEHILDALEDLTVSALEVVNKTDQAAESGDSAAIESGFKNWETLIQMNHSLLSALGVSHPKLEEINMILAKNGLKGKLTGAGGGGFAISVLPPSYDPEEVIRILKEHDFGVIATKLGSKGIRVE